MVKYKTGDKMKILVTGGAGFIGSEFVRQAVKKEYEVVVVDKITYAGDLERLKEVEGLFKFYREDITDEKSIREIFAKEKPQVVVHFAAETHVDRSILDPRAFIKTNIEGTGILLELSRCADVERFINVSTDEVYGELGNKGKFKENSPLNPNSPYSVSKASSDMLGRAYFRTYGLPVITIRMSNNYGKWQYPEKFIPVVIIKAFMNEKIPVYGKGENIREWLYVSDGAGAILKIMEDGRDGEIYNVGSGYEKRNIDVVREILKIMDKDESLIEFVEDRPGHDFRYALDTTKIREQLKWKPEVEFVEGIERTISWYVDNFDWVERKLDFLRSYWSKVYKSK